MKNQTLQTLAVIYKRIQNSRNSNSSFQEVMDSNKVEIDFLVNKFNLKMEESLLLAGACISTISGRNTNFDIDDLASQLEVNNFEILLQQQHLKSLVEKGFLVEFSKECRRNCHNFQPAIAIMNKEFALHTSFGQHLA